MSDQHNRSADQTTTNRPDDLPLQHQVTDPITGTTAAGPFESAGRRPAGARWPMAAQWLAFALLLVLFLVVLYWVSGW